MIFVVFSGIDGCGKSSIIAGVRQTLRAEGVDTSEQWLRFHHVLCKLLHAVARVLGLSCKKVMTEGGAWRHEFYRSRWFSNLYIVCTYIDTLLGRRKALRQAQYLGCPVVIFDRWIPDILIDLAVKTKRENFLTGKWAARFLKLLPERTLLLCISRPEEALLACRAENREDSDFEFREKIYGEWIKQGITHEIANNSSLDESIHNASITVLNFIDQKQRNEE